MTSHPMIHQAEDDDQAPPTDEELREMTRAELRQVGAGLGLADQPPQALRAVLVAAAIAGCAAMRAAGAPPPPPRGNGGAPPPHPPGPNGGAPPPPPPPPAACGACGLPHALGQCPAADARFAASMASLLASSALDGDSVATNRMMKGITSLLGSPETVLVSVELAAALEGRVLAVGPDLVEAVARVARSWCKEELALVRDACARADLSGRHGLAWRILVPAALALLAAEAARLGIVLDLDLLGPAALDPIAFTRARELGAAQKALRADAPKRGRDDVDGEEARDGRQLPARNRRGGGGRGGGRKRGNGGGGGRGGPFTGTCFKCGKSGHRAAQCP